MSGKLWGGRFSKDTLREVDEFCSSLQVDARLWECDIRASCAHAAMLGRVGVLTKEEAAKIVSGLQAVARDFKEGKPTPSATAEDIHSEIERWLTEKIGPLAGKVHTGRSRNDQVATATRLYLREYMDRMIKELTSLCATLIELSEPHTETVLPGLTHVQHAQPVSLAHHLMAYFWMFSRDADRLKDSRKRVNHLPLGCAALAGTSFPLDRESVAKELGFEHLCENSLDAVSDRDFVVETLSCATLIMSHLSRLSEELVLWSCPAFGYVTLDDSVTTGSSIMPQKKNPDVAELIRGRMGKVQGAYVNMVTTLKGLPLSYNRDLQEDKEALFMGIDTASSSVRLMELMLKSAVFHPDKMARALAGDFSNATDLADHLVRQGLPFRQAHEVVGKIVNHCISSEIYLENLELAQLKTFSPLFTAAAISEIQHLAVMKARICRGGTAPQAVKKQISLAKDLLR